VENPGDLAGGQHRREIVRSKSISTCDVLTAFYVPKRVPHSRRDERRRVTFVLVKRRARGGSRTKAFNWTFEEMLGGLSDSPKSDEEGER
jgi:hypothetical protein